MSRPEAGPLCPALGAGADGPPLDGADEFVADVLPALVFIADEFAAEVPAPPALLSAILAEGGATTLP